VIEFDFLATARDRQEFRDAIRLMRDLVSRSAMAAIIAEEVLPGPAAASDEALDAHVRASAETEYHPCGTCRMGLDALAVVDAELRVHGIPGLRVVDASVMPTVVSANLNGPTIMIAEKAADIILGRAPLPSAFPDGWSKHMVVS
jgi:choline dehydrogenase